jgi:hypothetical protein
MSTENSVAKDMVSAGLITNPSAGETVGAGGVYTVECVGADGQIKWTDTFHNLVMNGGLANMNGVYFASSAQSTTWYLGLVTGPGSGTTYSATDTLASHGSTGAGGWTENTAYTPSGRKAVTFGSATSANPSVISNSASPTSFSMNGTATIAGAFLCNVSTGTSGVLFSAGDFTGGDKSVASGDTLNVTYTFSLTAS